MTARANTVLGFLCAAMVFAPSMTFAQMAPPVPVPLQQSAPVAQPTPTTPQPAPASPGDICMTLARYDFSKTARAFALFQMAIFGKNPERWTPQDVTNLFSNISACNGKPLTIQATDRVSFVNWKRAFNDEVVTRTLQTAALSTEIANTFKPQWSPSLKMPYCADLLAWQRDPVWLTNNGKSIFGNTFYALSDVAAGAVKNYVNACRPVVIEIMKARKLKPHDGDLIVTDIVNAVDRDQSAGRFNQVSLIPEFNITHEGQQIPLSYLARPTQDVVLRLNTSEQNHIPLNVDELAAMSKWAIDMVHSNADGPDMEYVKVIKDLVSSQLFSQETKYDKAK